MAEVLSQSQIDALLSTMGTGGGIEKKQEDAEKDKKSYKKYDFYSPKKFTKEKLKVIKGIYDNYARIASSQINSLFRVSSEVEVITVEEQRYYEFSNALSENDILTLASVSLPDSSKNPPMLIHASPPVIVNMMDRMLGSSGNAYIVEDTYNYTDIEIALYERIMQYLVGAMRDAWTSYIKLDFTYDRIQKNPSMYQDMNVDETIVIIMLEVNMKEISGKMNICMPGDLLMSIFRIMESKKHVADTEEDDLKGSRSDIIYHLSESLMEVSAQLGTVQLNMDDIYRLHKGDVINLKKSRNAEIIVSVAGKPWFTGRMGTHKKNIAVQLDERISSEAPENRNLA